jgi:hypothetical protein
VSPEPNVERVRDGFEEWAMGSGVEVDMHYFASFKVAEGKATRWVDHLERSEALEAGGLSE